MSEIITNNFRTYLANNFINSLVDTANTVLYTFIGNPFNYANESYPTTAENYYDTERAAWHDMLALKKVTRVDAKLVVPRYDWASGTSYARYNDKSTSLIGSNFYVLTSPELRVYLCIDNNNSSASTIKPTSTNTSSFTTSDGYKWKYLYSLTDEDVLKFLTRQYMPVNENSSVKNAAIGGEIKSIEIINSGTDYSSSSTAIVLKGDGSNFAATPVLANSSVVGINITNPGSGYTYAELTVTGSGSNANIRPIITPTFGHGLKVYEQLGAKYVLINSRYIFSEGLGDFPIVNEYRKIGLIRNPKRYDGNLASNITLTATGKITARRLSGTFVLDEKITGNINLGNAFIVSANVETPNVVIKYLSPRSTLTGITSFSVNEGITGSNSGAFARILKIEPPEVTKHSGEILYVENREKITRSFDQAENLHIVIEF